MEINERNKMVMDNMGLVVKTAQEIWRPGLSYEDLFQEGVKGLIQAVNGFNPDKKAKFSSYAIRHIRGMMFHWIVDDYGVTRIKSSRVRSLFFKFDVTSEHDMAELRRIQAVGKPVLLDKEIEPDSKDESTYIDKIVIGEDPIKMILANERKKLTQEAMRRFRDRLTPHEQLVWDNKVVKLSYDEGKSVWELAGPIGVSHETVRKMHHNIIKRFASYVTNNGLYYTDQPNTSTPRSTHYECTKCGEKAYFGEDEEGVTCHKCGNLQLFGKEMRYPIKIKFTEAR